MFSSWCNTCKTWKGLLESYHENHLTVIWEKMNSMIWSNGPESIAEVFVPPGWNSTCINLQDVSTCLSIWDKYKYPHPMLQSDHKGLIQTAKPLRESRNVITHQQNLTLPETTTVDCFSNIRNVLNHPLIQKSLPANHDILTKLYDLEQDCTKCKCQIFVNS